MTKRTAARLQISGLILVSALVLASRTGAQDRDDVRVPQAKPGAETVQSDRAEEIGANNVSKPQPSPRSGQADADQIEQSGLVPRPRPGAASDAPGATATTTEPPLQEPSGETSSGPNGQPAARPDPVLENADAAPEASSVSENAEIDPAEPAVSVPAEAQTALEIPENGLMPRPRPGSNGTGGAGEMDVEDDGQSEIVLVAAPAKGPAKAEAAGTQEITEPIELTAAPAEGDAPVEAPVEPTEDANEVIALLPVPRPGLKETKDVDDGPVDDHVLAALTPDEAREDIDCKWRLKSLGAAFEELDPMDGAGACGIKAPILVTELATDVRMTPKAILNCRTAYSLARWVADSVVPQAEEHLESKFTGVRHGSTYVCRNRNNQPGGKLSEHATGNAVDIVAIEVEEGPPIAVVDRSEEDTPVSEFQKAIRAGACDHFTTVLGPGTNAFHSTHFHFDMAQRNGGYRLCE